MNIETLNCQVHCLPREARNSYFYEKSSGFSMGLLLVTPIVTNTMQVFVLLCSQHIIHKRQTMETTQVLVDR